MFDNWRKLHDTQTAIFSSSSPVTPPLHIGQVPLQRDNHLSISALWKQWPHPSSRNSSPAAIGSRQIGQHRDSPLTETHVLPTRSSLAAGTRCCCVARGCRRAARCRWHNGAHVSHFRKTTPGSITGKQRSRQFLHLLLMVYIFIARTAGNSHGLAKKSDKRLCLHNYQNGKKTTKRIMGTMTESRQRLMETEDGSKTFDVCCFRTLLPADAMRRAAAGLLTRGRQW